MSCRFRIIICVVCFAFLLFVLGCSDEKDSGEQYTFVVNSVNEDRGSEIVCNKDSEIYYVTPYGKKYHCADCSYIKRDLSECRKFSDIEAEEKGYAPCSRCIG